MQCCRQRKGIRTVFILALLIEEAHGWDYAITAAVSAMGLLVTIVGYLLKKRLETYDKHLEECNKRAVITGRTDERLKVVEAEVMKTHTAAQWLGSCILIIGTKMGVDLPDRPN